MSNRYITAAMECRVGNPTKKLILIKLADNANDDGLCWPSYSTIARHCECDKRTVIRHIKEMQEMGILSKQQRLTKHGNTSNYFHLTIPKPDLLRGDNLSLGGDRGSPGGCQIVTRGVTEDHPEPSIEPSVKPSNKQDAKLTFDDTSVLQDWNDFANYKGLPRIKVLTENHKKLLKRSHKAYCKLRKAEGKEAIDDVQEFVQGYLQEIDPLVTPFHSGQNDTGWRVTFDYAFAKQVVENVINSGVLKR